MNLGKNLIWTVWFPTHDVMRFIIQLYDFKSPLKAFIIVPTRRKVHESWVSYTPAPWRGAKQLSDQTSAHVLHYHPLLHASTYVIGLLLACCDHHDSDQHQTSTVHTCCITWFAITPVPLLACCEFHCWRVSVQYSRVSLHVSVFTCRCSCVNVRVSMFACRCSRVDARVSVFACRCSRVGVSARPLKLLTTDI